MAAAARPPPWAWMESRRKSTTGTLLKKLRSTNAIENLNSGIATYSKNVKRWQSGSRVVRWASAAGAATP
jgi:hypothetical protein